MLVATIASTHKWADRKIRKETRALAGGFLPIGCAEHILIQCVDGPDTLNKM